MERSRENITALSRDALRERLLQLGFRSFRADQIRRWIYGRCARSFEEMTNISKHERSVLDSLFVIAAPVVIRVERSRDGTRKFLFGLADGHRIESVLIPDEDRNTLCISSQVGCAQACRFCLTGAGGFTRDLTSAEIVDQVLEVSRLLREEGAAPVTNIVFMGMGEPLDNLDAVLEALAVIASPQGMGFSPRRITVSTDGIAPGIERLGAAATKVNLAVSLNATTDAVRDSIMPVNRRYPLRTLLAACRRYPLAPRRRITFEYVLLGGVNDTPADARRLVGLLHGLRCKVNLIPFNPFPGSAFTRPDERRVREFQSLLLESRLTAPVRESRGRDISAACGQLRERESAAPTPAP